MRTFYYDCLSLTVEAFLERLNKKLLLHNGVAPRSPVALPLGGKSSNPERRKKPAPGPAWLEIKTVKFFEGGARE